MGVVEKGAAIDAEARRLTMLVMAEDDHHGLDGPLLAVDSRTVRQCEDPLASEVSSLPASSVRIQVSSRASPAGSFATAASAEAELS